MAAKLTTHPSNETLQALSLGKLDEADAQAALRHLESCPDCCQKAAALPGDSFLNRLRNVHGRNETSAPSQTPRGPTEPRPVPPPSAGLTQDFRRQSTSDDAKASHFPEGFPASFGRYRVLKLLGKGGMGAVYLAQDTQLDRPVALKMPHFETGDGPQVLERFFREARAAATLQHANICPLHDVGQIDGTPYLTMAYIEGKSLAAFAASRPLTARQSGLLVRKLALALQEAHKRGVIHRDLKPENVMIDRRGEPIIMDFGLARRTRGQDTRLTQQGSLLGTPAYMPPEQVSGDVNATGPASDIYSLGVILYELLTGRLPFHGDAMAMLSQVLMDEPPRPSTLRPGLEPEMEAICLKAMAKKSEDRYASMAEFAAALTDALRARPAGAQSTVAPLPKPTASPQSKSGPMSIHVSQMGGARSVAMLFNQPPAPKAAADRPSRRPKRARRRRIPVWVWLASAGIGVSLLALVILSSVGVFRVNTKDGVYEVKVDVPNADIYVDHERATVTWNNGGTQAEIRVRPGTHKVEVKKDGVTAYGEEVAVEEGGVKIITARFNSPAGDKGAPEKRLVHVVEVTPDRGELLHEIHWERPGGVYTANFSPDGRRCLISGDSDLLLLYDVQTGQPVGQRMKGFVSVFMPGGKEILAGVRPGSVFHIYDLDGREIRQFHGKDVLDNFTLSPRGDRLLTMSPGVHRLLDMKDGREIKKWPCDPNATFTFFAPDGQYLFRLVDGKLPWRVYRTGDGTEVKTFENITGIESLRGFFPDGQRVYGREAGEVQVYDVSSGKKVEELEFGPSPVAAVTLSPDGKRFLTAHQDHQVRLWDVAGDRELCSFPTVSIPKVHYMTLNFSADGQYGCAGGGPGWVYLWRLPRP